jgi:tetratricopeptide (TPR) repeat protein
MDYLEDSKSGETSRQGTMGVKETLEELERLFELRQIGAGIELLERNRALFTEIGPGYAHAGEALSTLAQWVDTGFDGEALLSKLLERFPASSRAAMPFTDYLHLRMAEAVLALRREELAESLRHLDVILTLGHEIGDSKMVILALHAKARCLRKAGEYDQAFEITRRGIEAASAAGLVYFAAILRTIESWLLFQKGRGKEALKILEEAEAVLRDADDLITQGNIQSAYGRIAVREGRYDRAIQYFEASIELFKQRPSLERYLARSLTNMAEAQRLAALQLRRSMDAKWERRRNGREARDEMGRQEKAAQLERMHQLLRSAQANLAQADAIYRPRGDHHGAGNVDVSLAQIYLDLGNLDEAEKRASEAFQFGATKKDYLVMARARIVEAMVANARFEEEIGEAEDSSRFAQIAHDCSKEAIDLAERTGSRRLRAQAYICHGLTLVNGFFSDIESARTSCDRAESCLEGDRHDPLWRELELLRSRILHAGIEDPNLRAWSQGAVGGKSLESVVAEFEELVIRRVWEQESFKVARVARRLSVSPKKVRRVLRHLGLLASGA